MTQVSKQARRPTGQARRPVYVVDGARTPFLKAPGRPGPFTASDLAVAAGRPLLLRQPFPPQELDEVILGCVIPGPDEANIARVAALRMGCGDEVPAWTVQRNCGSGMQAIDSAMQRIADHRADLVLAGGTESMSHAPLLWAQRLVEWLAAWSRARGLMGRAKALTGLRLRDLRPVIGLLRGLTDHVVGLSMGQTAELLASRFGIEREAMDAYAVESHRRLAEAQDQGRLPEVETLYDTKGNYYEHDDGLRRDSSVEKLARLRPVFDKPYGAVTAGNSAQVTDGAAWVLLASEDAVARHGLSVLARVVDAHWTALDPSQMGLGPVYAMAPVLARNKLTAADIDYWEINEAFAAQVLACLKAWQDQTWCKEQLGLDEPFAPIDRRRLNVDGGAVALGHPVGASGARIVLHLLQVLTQRGGRRGIASLCIGGGQGGAMLVEREQSEGG
jgi:acetyl-CoA C-acetyltransferase